MSARPDVPRLSEEDLDLLISRSLDGDLSPEEEQQLERLVTLDPAAARRKAELAALVAEVKALPEPAAPFAITTRVSANVAERAGRRGSLGGRVGFFPAPGFAKAALVILAIVGASIAILRPAPKRLAEGPVDVLLYDAPRPAAPETKTLVADSSVGKSDSRAKVFAKEKEKTASNDKEIAPETDERHGAAPPAREEVASAEKKSGLKARERAAERGRRRRGRGARRRPERAEAEERPRRGRRPRRRPRPGAREGRERGDSRGRSARAGRPRSAALGPRVRPVGGRSRRGPGEPRRRAAGRSRSAATRRAGGLFAALPTTRRPRAGPPCTASRSTRRDASRRCPGWARPRIPRLDAFVRGMVFEPIPRPAEVQSRLAAKDAKDAPASPADFEIGLEPR